MPSTATSSALDLQRPQWLRALVGLCSAAMAVVLALALTPGTAHATGTTWYLAEGTVRPGYLEYITIQTLTGPQGITISFQATTDGGLGVLVPDKSLLGVPANTRVTINVNDWLTSNSIFQPVSVSAKVVTTGDARVERPIYFNANPGFGVIVNGGTDAMAIGSPALEFYFAEGTVRNGFIEYITIQNPPGGSAANVTLTFQASKDDGSVVPITPKNIFGIPAGTRQTFNLNAYLAQLGINYGVNISTKVASDAPVVAERPMYFQFDPGNGVGALINGGTTVVGATAPTSPIFFAEGTVRPGFVEYLTIQNPGSLSANDVTISFQATDDSGGGLVIPSKHFGGADPPILAGSRVTFNVNQYLKDKNVPVPVNLSVRIDSDQPLVAERPMYFNADPALGAVANDGTTVVGAGGTSTTSLFAEGTVRNGFVQYITVQNPGATSADVTFAFQATDDLGNPVAVPDALRTVPAGRRYTLNVSQYFASQSVTIGTNVSTKVTSTQPIVAERPLYFQFDPGSPVSTLINGGTDVLGSP